MRLRKLITPFVGYGEFRLYQIITDAKALIKKIGATYTTELWANSECSNSVPWTIIRIQNQIHLFFANDKLFKIYLDNGCEGSLSNGIYIGMPIERALDIDKELVYDDWEEDYQSPAGYWIEDNIDDNTVMSISIFIKEALDEDAFDKYDW